MNEEREIKRGQVYFVREDDTVGAEMAIGRPVLVLSNQEMIDRLPTVTVAYLTTTPKRAEGTVKAFTGKKMSYILLNQLRTLDKSRLNELMWTLPDKDMERVNTALSYVLSLGDFLEEKEEAVVERNEVEEIASLKMELALHKALYEKTLEKLIELRLEKDGVTEKPKAIEVEKPKQAEEKISDREVTRILSSVNANKGSCKHVGKARLKRGAKPVNVNTASVKELESVGINDQTAKNIVNYRKRHGYFVSIEDLLMVPRFGRGCMAAFESVLEV